MKLDSPSNNHESEKHSESDMTSKSIPREFKVQFQESVAIAKIQNAKSYNEVLEQLPVPINKALYTLIKNLIRDIKSAVSMMESKVLPESLHIEKVEKVCLTLLKCYTAPINSKKTKKLQMLFRDDFVNQMKGLTIRSNDERIQKDITKTEKVLNYQHNVWVGIVKQWWSCLLQQLGENPTVRKNEWNEDKVALIGVGQAVWHQLIIISRFRKGQSLREFSQFISLVDITYEKFV